MNESSAVAVDKKLEQKGYISEYNCLKEDEYILSVLCAIPESKRVKDQLYENAEKQKTWLTAFLMKLHGEGFKNKDLLAHPEDYTTNYKGEIISMIRFNFASKQGFNKMFGIAHNITQGRGVIPLAETTNENEWSIVLVLCYKMRALIKQEVSLRINEIRTLISENPHVLNNSSYSIDFDSKPSDYDSARIKFNITSSNQVPFLKEKCSKKDYNFILLENNIIEVRNLTKGLYGNLIEKFREIISNSSKVLLSGVDLTPSLLRDFLNENKIEIASIPPLCFDPRKNAIMLSISDHSKSELVVTLFNENGIKFSNPKLPHVFVIKGLPDVKKILVKKVAKKNDSGIKVMMNRTEAKEKLEIFFKAKKINFNKLSNASAGKNAHYYVFEADVAIVKELIDSELPEFNVHPIVRPKQKGLIIEFLLSDSVTNSNVESEVPVEIKTEPKMFTKEISEFSADEIVADILKRIQINTTVADLFMKINKISNEYICIPKDNSVLMLEEGSLKIKDPLIQIEGAKKLSELIK